MSASTHARGLPDGKVATVLFSVDGQDPKTVQCLSDDGANLYTFLAGSNGYTLGEAQSTLRDTTVTAYKGSGNVSATPEQAHATAFLPTGNSSAIEVSARMAGIYHKYETPSIDVVPGGSWVLSDSGTDGEGKILLVARLDPYSVDETDVKDWIKLLEQEAAGTHVLQFNCQSDGQALLTALTCGGGADKDFLNGPLIPAPGSEFQRTRLKGKMHARPLDPKAPASSRRSGGSVTCDADISLVVV